jgi:anaerobic ribonucleoside-triphosphate reductase
VIESSESHVVFWGMTFPIKVCIVCSEEFELKPDKPGFANRCPECSISEQVNPTTKRRMDSDERKTVMEANQARRQAMRDLLYRKDS